MEIEFVGCHASNCNVRPTPEISGMVIHACACPTLEGIISWFHNPEANVSAHYSVDKNGRTVQHVEDSTRAWHAGTSMWGGRENLNDWTIGIEMINLNNLEDLYPDDQRLAILDLCLDLCEAYSISPDFVLAHAEVSPDRKTDPQGFDMNHFRQELRDNLDF